MNPVGDLSLLLPPLAVISSVLSPGQMCLKDLMWLCRKKKKTKKRRAKAQLELNLAIAVKDNKK